MRRKFDPIVRYAGILTITIGAIAVQTLAQVAAPAPANGEYHPSTYVESYQGTFYPGTELRALPPARAAAVGTYAQLQSAEATLTHTMTDLRGRADRSADMVQAQNEERAAADALKAVREQALADLKADPTYQATLDLKNRLAGQIEQAHADPKTTPEQTRAMAEVKLSHAATITAMESSAIGADPRVQAARERLVAAGNRVSALRQSADDAVRSNPDVLAARKAVEQARVASQAADAYFIEARNIARFAIDYTYDQMAQPRPYAVYDPYYGYPTTGANYPMIGGYPIGYPYSWRATGR